MYIKKSLQFKDKEFNYNLRKSKRALKMRISINSCGNLTVTIPYYLSEKAAEHFILEKADWINKKIDFLKKNKLARANMSGDEKVIILGGSKKEYLDNKNKAFELVITIIAYFISIYFFSFNKISIKNQSSRWGSCSKSGNLSFNYKIIYLSRNTADYIILHELCHLKEFNHSKRFWSLVEEIMEIYKKIKKEFCFLLKK